MKLLKAGADPTVYGDRTNKKFVHTVVSEETKIRSLTNQAKADYREIVQILIDHGESIEEARKDIERWSKRGRTLTIAKLGELRRKEVAERKARQKAEAEKKAALKKENPAP